MHSEDDGWPAEKQYQDAQWDESVDGDDRRMRKEAPRANGTEPDEYRDIEQHIDGWLERVIHRLEAEPVIPSKRIAGDEAGEHVVATDHATCTHNEELHAMSVKFEHNRPDLGTYSQSDGKNQETFAVDVFPLFGPMKQFFCDPSHCSSINDT